MSISNVVGFAPFTSSTQDYNLWNSRYNFLNSFIPIKEGDVTATGQGSDISKDSAE